MLCVSLKNSCVLTVVFICFNVEEVEEHLPSTLLASVRGEDNFPSTCLSFGLRPL